MRTRNVKRQKNQLELAFDPVGKGEAPNPGIRGPETRRTARDCRDPAGTDFRHWKPGRKLNQPNRRVRTRTHGGVGGVGAARLPPYPDEPRAEAAGRCPGWRD